MAELRGTLDGVLRRRLRELQGRPQKLKWTLFQLREWRNLVVGEEKDMRGHISHRSIGSRTERSGQGSTSLTRNPGIHWPDETNNHSQRILIVFGTDSYKAKHFAMRLAFLNDTVKSAASKEST